MNLWVRLLNVLLRLAVFRAKHGKPIGLFDTTRLTLRIWPNDLDTNLHVNNGRYLTIGDLGRLDWFVRIGVMRVARAQRAIPVVGDALAKFRRSLKVFDKFVLETRLLGWDEKWGFIEHRFVRHGRVIGIVVIRGVFLAPAGPLRPADLLNALAQDHEPPTLPRWVRDWSDSCDSLSRQLRQEESQSKP